MSACCWTFHHPTCWKPCITCSASDHMPCRVTCSRMLKPLQGEAVQRQCCVLSNHQPMRKWCQMSWLHEKRVVQSPWVTCERYGILRQNGWPDFHTRPLFALMATASNVWFNPFEGNPRCAFWFSIHASEPCFWLGGFHEWPNIHCLIALICKQCLSFSPWHLCQLCPEQGTCGASARHFNYASSRHCCCLQQLYCSAGAIWFSTHFHAAGNLRVHLCG